MKSNVSWDRDNAGTVGLTPAGKTPAAAKPRRAFGDITNAVPAQQNTQQVQVFQIGFKPFQTCLRGGSDQMSRDEKHDQAGTAGENPAAPTEIYYMLSSIKNTLELAHARFKCSI